MNWMPLAQINALWNVLLEIKNTVIKSNMN